MSDNSIRKILGESTSKKKPETPPENDEYQAFSYGRIGNRPQLMIVFRKADGYCEAHPYSMISRLYSSNPDREIFVEFLTTKVSLKGNELQKLFLMLLANRVCEVTESCRENGFECNGSETVISSIEMGQRQRKVLPNPSG